MRAVEPPPYRVPSMAEIAAVPPNGLRLVSTFSGCGGSCLGFRMEGFRTLWASEFIEEARATYEANHPGVHVDPRDIREVTAEDILAATGLRAGELDVFEGSPPCASFSTAGKGAKHWGKVKSYSDSKQRTDDLFLEWLRLLEGLKPRAFVAENVSGLVKGKAKGWFLDILARMKAAGYRVSARVLDAQWLGVPQARQRTIFVGLREDVAPGVAPPHPEPLPYRYALRDVLPHLRSVVHDTSGQPQYSAGECISRPAPPITVSGGAQHHHFKIEDISRFAIGEEWDRLRPGVPSDVYFNLLRPRVDGPCPTVTAEGGNPGAAAVTHPTERRKFTLGELRRVCAFPDDFVLTGTYTQGWERLGRAVPPVMMAAVARGVARVLLSDRAAR